MAFTTALSRKLSALRKAGVIRKNRLKKTRRETAEIISVLFCDFISGILSSGIIRLSIT
jgi:hypothetical protein